MRLLAVALLLSVGAAAGVDERPQTMRTQLKVARSLGPTETVIVKTREGGTASLVVAPRAGRAVGHLPPPANPANLPRAKGIALPPPVDVRSEVYVKSEKRQRYVK